MDISNKINFDFKTTQKLINLIAQVDGFNGKWQAVEVKENTWLRELKRIATIQSIGSSTRIEGATLSNDEVRELLDNLKITKLTSRDSQEVIGYYDALEIIYDNYTTIDLTEANIKHLHNILLKYSGKDERHKGKYKSLSNKVVANYPGDIQKVIFNTTEPHLVGKEIEDLLIWTNGYLHNREIHPLITLGTFIYEFLSIHPFQDGNGRLSRLLTTLLLLRSEYWFIQYVSFENLIEERKSEYYRALMEGQKNRNTESEKINDWLLFFLDCLITLTKRLGIKYDTLKAKGGYLNTRQKEILKFIRENQPVKTSDVMEALYSYSPHTLKKDLIYMRSEKAISTIGKGRGTVYITPEANEGM